MSSSSDSATSATTRTFFRSNREPRSSPVPPAPFKRRDQHRPRGGERRRDAEQHAGRAGQQQREQQHRSIDREVEGERQRAGRWRRRARTPATIPHASATPATPPIAREQNALGEQLPDQPAAAGAEREPHRELALPRRGPRQQQVGDVRAGDQQHRAHRPAEQHRDRAHLLPLTGERLVHADDRHAGQNRVRWRLHPRAKEVVRAPGRARRLPARAWRRPSAGRCRRSSCWSDSSAGPGSARRSIRRAAAA